MKDKKLRVFVSSTFTDLKDERQAAVEAILSSGHIPAGMELFSAGDESQMAVIERWIDESDIYLLILGGRYGSIESKTGKSYTHLEYEYATSKNKPLFAVVVNDEALENKVRSVGSSVKEDENPKELKNFREQVTKNLVKFWDDKKDIKIAIHETLAEFVYRKELIGWIRGNNAINTVVVAEEIARLTKENAELRSRINSGSDNALYAGFSFDQLAMQLKKEFPQESNLEYSVYNYLCEKGNSLIDGNYIDNKYQSDLPILCMKILIKYKLVVTGGWIASGYRYSFTSDGHKFYLKALYYINNSE